MPRNGVRIGYGKRILSPADIAGLAAWYDVSDPTYLLKSNGSPVTTSGDAVALIADRSSNSNTNVLTNGSTAASSVRIPTATTIGTGQLTISARGRIPTLAEMSSTAQGSFLYLGPSTAGSFGANSLYAFFDSSGNFIVTKRSGADGFQAVTTINNFYTNYGGAERTITIRRDATNWTIFIDGSSVGTSSSFFSETVDSTYLCPLTVSTNYYTGYVKWIRFYNTGLSNAEVLADANGTVQAGNIVNCDFSVASKLASSFTCTSGQTCTVGTSGDLGARISGARDLVQLTTANQPVYLPWGRMNYGYLNGTSGNYFSTPDSAVVSITGDLDIRVRATVSDWTPGTSNDLVAKWSGAAATSSYMLRLNLSGRLELFSSNGVAILSSQATAGLPLTDGQPGWIRATLDVDDGAGNHITTFYYALDSNNAPTSWTQLGTAITVAGVISIVDTATELRVGQSNNNPVSGSIYRAQVLNGINGTIVADFDPSYYTSGTTFIASTGETWTLNGGSTIVTNTSLYFDGSTDYMKTAIFSLSQPETVYFVGQQVSWTNTDYIYDGGTADNMGLFQSSSSPNVILRVTPSGGISLSTWLIGAIGIITSIFNGASSSNRHNRNSTVTGTLGTGGGNGFTLGAYGSAALFGNIRFNEICIYSTANDSLTQNFLVYILGKKWGISV